MRVKKEKLLFAWYTFNVPIGTCYLLFASFFIYNTTFLFLKICIT